MKAKKNLEKKIAKFVLKTAIHADTPVSLWGIYQPVSPKLLKENNNKKVH